MSAGGSTEVLAQYKDQSAPIALTPRPSSSSTCFLGHVCLSSTPFPSFPVPPRRQYVPKRTVHMTESRRPQSLATFFYHVFQSGEKRLTGAIGKCGFVSTDGQHINQVFASWRPVGPGGLECVQSPGVAQTPHDRAPGRGTPFSFINR